ncbi:MULTISPECIES: hypothetical protein [Betaproteobacteria]|uniref:hypothetical protein n=1 Tax=Betaproteobacteria TaxID=28216 RepID=UPI001A910DFA|nr:MULTISPECIES: hypothetical protein [Betaproteobacteria]MBO0501758.1 hypothetical protein [Chromobacterium haemolyticum]MCW3640555.1 hypothetical protein [Burkholderia cenocepacia]
MNPNLFHRLYQRLSDLVPDLANVTLGSTFFAPPRIAGDMSIYCSVSSVQDGVIELEMAHDQVVKGEEQPAPWMVFRVDVANQQAELLAVQDEWRYEVVYSEDNRANPRRIPMNLFAVNWLTIMLNLHSVFQPVAAPALTLA